jgi:hypothetical protein
MTVRSSYALVAPIALALIAFAAASRPATPATKLCVKPQGASGCYSTIQAAVNAAMPHDVIDVFDGTYAEDVVIGIPLTLRGQDKDKTIIDARKRSNGIFIDGLDNPGLGDVHISHLTVMNAKFEGIVAANATRIEIRDNVVKRNNRALDINNTSCPGIPTWETDEHFDCGEGIHISGVGNSTIAGNRSEGNSGGILVSDDTAKVHDNVIVGNYAVNNPFDCGIVLASHPPGPGSSSPHYGVVDNWVVGNVSLRNGYKRPGEGAGVGMFADGTGPGFVNGNTVVDNIMNDNGLPGAILQSHASFDNLSGNAIVNNSMSGNGALELSTTGIDIYSALGPSHLSDTVVSGNTVTNEQVDVSFDEPTHIALHSNSLLGGTVGVFNGGTGSVDATYNWWGCATGPGTTGCSTVMGPRLRYKPWLKQQPSNARPQGE